MKTELKHCIAKQSPNLKYGTNIKFKYLGKPQMIDLAYITAEQTRSLQVWSESQSCIKLNVHVCMYVNMVLLREMTGLGIDDCTTKTREHPGQVCYKTSHTLIH